MQSRRPTVEREMTDDMYVCTYVCVCTGVSTYVCTAIPGRITVHLAWFIIQTYLNSSVVVFCIYNKLYTNYRNKKYTVQYGFYFVDFQGFRTVTPAIVKELLYNI